MTMPLTEHDVPRPAAQDADCAAPVYFGTSGRTLFGWHHPALHARCAVVICAPLGSEATGWYRASRHWAERLAASGIAALRFDYDGAGDSLGDMTDPRRLQAWVDSVTDAVTFLSAMSKPARVVVAGARLGATLALAAARSPTRIDGLILWAPFTNGRAFLREGRALTRLMAPRVVTSTLPSVSMEQFGGLALTRDAVQELEGFEPLAGARLEMPVLLLPRDDGAGERSLMEALAAAGAHVEQKATGGIATVLGDAHQGEIPNATIQASIDWLTTKLGADDRGRTADASRPRYQGRTPRTGLVDASGVGMSERAIRIGDRRLFGILTEPYRVARRNTGVLLVNSGSVYRAGPNRLHVTLARQWARLGYTVLRMDLAGLGDSPACEPTAENHPYPPHAVGDVAAGVAALRDEGVQHVVVGGLCSGAHTAFHAALTLEGIDGVLLVNPIVFYWKSTDPLDVSAWRVYVEARHYRMSVVRWSSWRKLFSGGVSLSYVGRIIYHRMGEIARAKMTAATRRLGSRGSASQNAPRDLSRIANRGTNVLLLFSEGDPGLDHLSLNYGRELARLARLPRFDMRIVADADHTFTTLAARHRVSGMLTEHLLAHHE